MDELLAFRPPSTILAPPVALRASTPSPAAMVDLARLAEHVVASMRVGHVGREGRLVDLRLRLRGGEISLRIVAEGGTLAVRVQPHEGPSIEAASFARAVGQALRDAGLDGATVEVAPR